MPFNLSSELQHAMELHQANKLNQAKQRYEAILEAAPRQPDALHFLGLLHFQNDDGETAVALIRQAIDARPDYADAHNNLGNILKGQGDLAGAESSYRSAIALKQEDPNAHGNLCVVLKGMGRHDEAVESGLRAVELAPGLAFLWLNLANALKHAGREQQALQAYGRAVELEPGLTDALGKFSHLKDLLEQRGELELSPVEEQISAYEKMLEKDPSHPIARHMLAALKGEDPPERAPDDYVAALFDEMADGFDSHLAALGCKVPELVRSRLEAVLPVAAGRLDTLDAGCGTGLLGGFLKAYSATLTGVDLSPAMLVRAEDTGYYDRLFEAELTDFLARSGFEFDLAVCADTLCYFGDLEPVLLALLGSLRPGGRLVFTTELSPGDAGEVSFRLHSHGRYSHGRSYLWNLMSSLNLDDVHMEAHELRMEYGQPVSGCVVTARLPAN